MPDFLIPCSCNRCGETGESILGFRGPHIIQLCHNCGKYVKFLPKGNVPTVYAIKTAIWETTQDLEKIQNAKSEIAFKTTDDDFYNRLQYYKLYKKIK